MASSRESAAAESERQEGVWVRGGLGPYYMFGTFRSEPASGTREFPLDAPGAELSTSLGYLVSARFALGAYADLGLFFGGGDVSRTSQMDGASHRSFGVIASLGSEEGLRGSAVAGARWLRLMGSDSDLGGVEDGMPYLQPMAGPMLSLAGGWYGGGVGVETKVTYLNASGPETSFWAVAWGIGFSAEYW